MNCASGRNGSKDTISFSKKFLRSERKNRVKGRLKEGMGLLNIEDLEDTQGGRSREHCWEGVSRDRRLEGKCSQGQRWLGAEGKGEVSRPERREGAVQAELAQTGAHSAPTAVSQRGEGSGPLPGVRLEVVSDGVGLQLLGSPTSTSVDTGELHWGEPIAGCLCPDGSTRSHRSALRAPFGGFLSRECLW